MTAAEYAQGLRDLADLIERHPEIEPKLVSDGNILIFARDRDAFVEKLKILEGVGNVSRAKYVEVTRRFGPIRLTVYTNPEVLGTTTTKFQQVEVIEWAPSPEVAPILQAFGQVPA